MHDIANITYSFLFLTDEHGCLFIVGLSDLHSFDQDCEHNPWKLFDGPIDSSHITHLVYIKPKEAFEIVGPIMNALMEKRTSQMLIPAYLMADAEQALQTGEPPPGWYPEEKK